MVARRVTQTVVETDIDADGARRVTQTLVEIDLSVRVPTRITQLLIEVDIEAPPPPPPPPSPVPPFRPHAGQHGISMSVFKPRITLAP